MEGRGGRCCGYAVEGKKISDTYYRFLLEEKIDKLERLIDVTESNRLFRNTVRFVTVVSIIYFVVMVFITLVRYWR